MRRNADNFITLAMTGKASVEHIYNEYASNDFADVPNFRALLNKVTEDYGALVIDNSDANFRGKERFKRFRAKPLEELRPRWFTMLCPAAWGARDADHRDQLANEQRERLKPGKKYKASYMKKLKNAHETQVSREQVKGTTKKQQDARSLPTDSLFARLATRHSTQ